MDANVRDYRDDQDFHDVEGGPPFQEWTAGMEQHRPRHTAALDGTLTLHRQDGAVLDLALDDRVARWHVARAPVVADAPDWFASGDGEGTATVLPLQDGIFFIDILIDAGEPEDATCATVVYDQPGSRALIVYSWTFDRGDARRSRSAIHAAGVGGPAAEHIERTGDLIGRRAMWVYSDDHAYEHIYLNHGTYAWHCLSGPERSIADVDQTKTYKIADDIYAFFVTETVFPWDGIFVLNFTPGTCSNIGRFFGWDPKPDVMSHANFGARGRILNQTEYAFRV